jgi:hypothetical protein
MGIRFALASTKPHPAPAEHLASAAHNSNQGCDKSIKQAVVDCAHSDKTEAVQKAAHFDV